jgi:putative glutamine amidotransferase
MPVLGICRGMQLLNVALGGTLIQHLPHVVGHSEHLHTPGAFGDHDVRLEPGSLAARAAGADRITVKSHHHQGADRLGEGLRATGWSAADDVVEAIELPESADPFALGVLWHPEEEGESAVISSLVEATKQGVA